MKEIQLTQGKVALVDDEDFEYLNQFKWCAQQEGHTFYAARQSPRINKKSKTIRMHRAIMNPPNNMHIDHKDHNGLNNCRSNLRICYQRENQINVNRRSDNTSGYKGVCWHNGAQKWASRIKVNGKDIHLGVFTDIKDAALAYNKAAVKFFGEFALLNEI